MSREIVGFWGSFVRMKFPYARCALWIVLPHVVVSDMYSIFCGSWFKETHAWVRWYLVCCLHLIHGRFSWSKNKNTNEANEEGEVVASVPSLKLNLSVSIETCWRGSIYSRNTFTWTLLLVHDIAVQAVTMQSNVRWTWDTNKVCASGYIKREYVCEQTHMVHRTQRAHFIDINHIQMKWPNFSSLLLERWEIHSCYVSLFFACNLKRNKITDALRQLATHSADLLEHEGNFLRQWFRIRQPFSIIRFVIVATRRERNGDFFHL